MQISVAEVRFDEKPKPGDLIEIFRGTYQHWAVYIGNGFVIHLAPPTETARGGANSMMSVLSDKAKVKQEQLWEVVGDDEYHINNLLDNKYEPRNCRDIVKDAQRLLGQEQPFCVFNRNCEHFATELRYGKAESRQVCHALQVGVGVGVGLAAVIGAGVLAAAIFGGRSKENKNNQ
ncbi:hypothetical protein SKAU_G00369630 [Synaphobranchus kaupii]|uniref:LRAT domain-containing protein n=1 Tax=Synaphobranchus kaupii TaxID=118154 RepID=A0A9Q1IFN8_SYNKA|nr:hypothetical protein SKAU_G00369630 [Synaphobranchus kaupii]